MNTNSAENTSQTPSSPPADSSRQRTLHAFVAPFICFMLFLALCGGISKFAADFIEGSMAFWFVQPEYWLYPLQTIACLILLAIYWQNYEFRWTKAILPAVIVGIVVLIIWIAPQLFWGKEPRLEGFDPSIFEHSPIAYWTTISMRFIRLVVAVPLLEEIFWRGFLLRYLIREGFATVPFGKFSWFSFSAVTLCFGLAHAGPDFWVAIITGILYNGLACLTRSLGACVIAHAITNLLLGIYIMESRQWGFW